MSQGQSASASASGPRRPLQRSHSNFAARTARDDAGRLAKRLSIASTSPSPGQEIPSFLESQKQQAGELTETNALKDDSHFSYDATHPFPTERIVPTMDLKQPHREEIFSSWTPHKYRNQKRSSNDAGKPKPGAFPRPVGGTGKLGTFAGVFVPTSLNVLSILMFLRFGFILGQSGVTGMMGMLIVCYAINLLTTMSLAAIASNGTVRGGGAYYLISRSLGPEFGGSIGIVFYLGFVFNTGMNAVGLIDCFIENFGSKTGGWAQWLPEGFWYQYLWATLVLLICTAICLAGSALFARCSNGLLAILLCATFSIPFSALIVQPFTNDKSGIRYTGLSLDTLKSNLLPHLTKGAAGSQLKGKETWQDLFGILFPATGGIFAGASMSGDLKHPSKAIPKGTLYGLLLTFVSYALVVFAMAATIPRESLYRKTNVLQYVNISGTLILLGEFATSFFSALMGVIGSAKLLQALARDHLIPGLSIFGQGTKKNDEPTYAIIITYILAQATMLADINALASFVTMTYLMTFLVTNLACFLLRIGSAPNFRPSFHYFNSETAAIGAVVSGATMFFVDGVNASACYALLIFIFVVIHFSTPPKPWGDVSQSLIYHQVRKYLLRLRQEHVKFWRPQILLFINDPRRQYKLIQFCNSLKKGALFVLGHVIIAENFSGAVPEAKKQQANWTKYIDFSKIKAFVNIAISPAIEWGTRNIVLSAGLGGMRPNIVVMGSYNFSDMRNQEPLIDISSSIASLAFTSRDTLPNTKRRRRPSGSEKLRGTLPTDANRPEGAITARSYVTILEDLLLRLQINVAVARGFQALEFPLPKPTRMEKGLQLLHLAHNEEEGNTKKFIDLWPIQMSAEIAEEGDKSNRNVLTTNFDTYTLILQLGCILATVDSWRRAYKLRVIVFVEYESDVEEERERVTTLLANLRIQAKVLVFWLASGNLKSYEVIVNGKTDGFQEAVKAVDEALKDEEFWQDLQSIRGKRGPVSAAEELRQVEGLLGAAQTTWPEASFQQGRRMSIAKRFVGLRKLLKKKRRASVSGLRQLGASYGMRTHRLHPDLVSAHGSDGESSDDGLSSEATYSDSAASENDMHEYEMSDDDSQSETPIRRARSIAEGIRHGPAPHKEATSAPQLRTTTADGSNKNSGPPPQPSAQAIISDTSIKPLKPTSTQATQPASPVSKASPSDSLPVRPPTIRHRSMPKFTSKPTPRTKVAAEDGPGPSIMFTDQPSPPADLHPSIYSRPTPSPGTKTDAKAQSFTYPFPQSIPLSFNDLPSRAQHLILNELVRSESELTAVVFTTLPSPVEGTCESEEDSVKYLSDLEVLCQELPPVLLVHSNSMTVTMNL